MKPHQAEARLLACVDTDMLVTVSSKQLINIIFKLDCFCLCLSARDFYSSDLAAETFTLISCFTVSPDSNRQHCEQTTGRLKDFGLITSCAGCTVCRVTYLKSNELNQ